MTPTRRALALVAVVAGLAVTALLLPLHAVPEAVARLGAIAPLAGVAVGAALLMALVPRTPISVACGLLFGAGLGIVCALAAALLAAALTFTAGRWLGRDFVMQRAGRRWQRVEQWVTREGVLAVAAVRSTPLGPYGLVGYAYGTSSVRIRDYVIGTTVAAIPSAVAYALVGAAIAGPDALSPATFVPLAFGVLLSLVVVVRTRRHLRRQQPAS